MIFPSGGAGAPGKIGPIKIQFHKDNLRHLSRFPDFFVTKRILSSPPSCFFLVTQTWGLSERVERKKQGKKVAKRKNPHIF
jgi:hypothetical protein